MIELILGGYIYHVQPTPKQIKRTSFQKNVILKNESGLNVIVGNNSIGKPIFGLGQDLKISDNLNFKVGGYIQDRNEFEKLGVTIPTGDFMPVVGFEHTIEINESIGLTNFISPVILFSGLKFKF